MTPSRNIPALNRNVATVLRNVERKCAGKGITWLACPKPSKGGKPVGCLWVSLDPVTPSHVLTLSFFPASAPE